jgi:hypothetical protein
MPTAWLLLKKKAAEANYVNTLIRADEGQPTEATQKNVLQSSAREVHFQK